MNASPEVLALAIVGLGVTQVVTVVVLWRLVRDVAYLLWVHEDPDLHPRGE